MLLRAVIASVALLCFSVAQADEPKWLKDARAREGKTTVARPLKSKDDWLKALVPAKVVGDIVKEKESYSITFDIGADAPIYCEAVPGGFDMADMLHRTLDLTLKQIEDLQGKIEAKTLEFSDAGALGNVPYLQTRWLYRVNDGKEARVGGLKQVVFETHGHGIYCAHVDLGYTKTFDTVSRALAQSFDAEPPAPPPYYFEIGTATLAGQKIGLVLSRLERDPDGDTKATQMTSMLFSAPNGDLTTQDALHIEWVHPDGTLINGSHFVSQNGELVTNVELKHSEAGWTVAGESQGKKLEEKLPGDVQPGTWIEQALEVRKLLAAENPVGTEHNIALWAVNDLVKLTDTKTKVTAKKSADEYAAHATAGIINADLTLETKSGMPLNADVPMGAQSLHIERVYVNGSF